MVMRSEVISNTIWCTFSGAWELEVQVVVELLAVPLRLDAVDVADFQEIT